VRLVAILASAAVLALGACGKKGPPLPPLVKLPAPPADFAAERRGDTVDLLFTVPAANTDNTRPANLSRVDIYAITSAEPLPPPQIVKRGARVATVTVKAPRDPDNTIEEDEPAADMEPTEGEGLAQGAIARLEEQLDAAALAPAAPPKASKRGAPPTHTGRALVPAPSTAMTRAYVAVGVSSRDHRGPFSKVVPVPLIPPPPAPGRPTVTYDEKAIRVAWEPVAAQLPVQDAPADGELPSTPLVGDQPAIRYHVYDSDPRSLPVRLTKTPVADAHFADDRIVWGENRCYQVRTVETLHGLSVESEGETPSCVKLEDTFPPAPPANLQSSPLEGAVNLIWDANTEKDLAGYIVLRGVSADALKPITDMPVQVTTFLDQVKPGVRYFYAVQAVDKAGNASAPSSPVEEAARD
jgi:predicted small lipoprotein YifL